MSEDIETVEPRVRVVVHDPGTGRIAHINVNVPLSLVAAQAGDGLVARVTDVAGITGAEWFIDGGVERLRPSLGFDRLEILADDLDVARLEFDGTHLALIDGEAFEVEGWIEITSDMPAVYRVELPDPFPYLPYSAEIVAR